MDIDDLSFNIFYLLLRNQYRKKYDLALTKCWTICVPCGDSLREISITKELVDDHILKPLPNAHFTSTDEKESHSYKIENNTIKLINDDEPNENYEVKIISVEKGYNNEFQPYNIIILNKPIHRKYKITSPSSQSDKLQLNRTISSYKEAVQFLQNLPDNDLDFLENIQESIENIDIRQCRTMNDLKQLPQNLIRMYWSNEMRKQSLDIQRDARFQKLLSVSLEIFIMYHLHDTLFPLISTLLSRQDANIKEKFDALNEQGIKLSQLGVKESLISSTPYAMVELANLDSQKTPTEKLMCLKGTLDFLVAEIKGVLADEKSKADLINENDDKQRITVLDTDNLIPLLLYVIIKCRVQKLKTNLFYIKFFNYSLSPKDSFSYTLVTFDAAMELLTKLDTDNSSKKIVEEEIESKSNTDLIDSYETLTLLNALIPDPLIASELVL